MHELLTKGLGGIPRSVSKKAAAIFLSISLTIIGSTLNEAKAAEVQEGIAAVTTRSLALAPDMSVSSLLNLPKLDRVGVPLEWQLPRLLDEDSDIASFIDKPENIIVEDADSHLPVLYGMITSAFGNRKHPVRGRVRHHNGIDLAARLGDQVLAPASGTVVFAGVRNGYGQVIEIDHGNGYTSLLAHHSKLLVQAGDLVDASTVIAKAGRTGVATGVHVHIEIRHHGALVNPARFLAK